MVGANTMQGRGVAPDQRKPHHAVCCAAIGHQPQTAPPLVAGAAFGRNLVSTYQHIALAASAHTPTLTDAVGRAERLLWLTVSAAVTDCRPGRVNCGVSSPVGTVSATYGKRRLQAELHATGSNLALHATGSNLALHAAPNRMLA